MPAILRVAQFADERSRAVRLKLEKGEMKISASSTETGESEDSLESAITPARPLTIGFNAQYLMDFLKASGPGRCTAGVEGCRSPRGSCGRLRGMIISIGIL